MLCPYSDYYYYYYYVFQKILPWGLLIVKQHPFNPQFVLSLQRELC